MFRQIVAMTLVALALPAAAQTGAGAMPGTAPAAPPVAATPEKKVCRRIEETGSIMGGTRICHTKNQWAAIDAANNNAAVTGRDVRGQAGGRVN